MGSAGTGTGVGVRADDVARVGGIVVVVRLVVETVGCIFQLFPDGCFRRRIDLGELVQLDVRLYLVVCAVTDVVFVHLLSHRCET